MGLNQSKEEVVPAECSLKILKKQKDILLDKVGEFDKRMKWIDHTIYNNAIMEKRRSSVALGMMKQLAICRGHYVEVLSKINCSILMMEEAVPLENLLIVLPCKKYTETRIANIKNHQLAFLLEEIQDILMGSLEDMYEIPYEDEICRVSNAEAERDFMKCIQKEKKRKKVNPRAPPLLKKSLSESNLLEWWQRKNNKKGGK